MPGFFHCGAELTLMRCTGSKYPTGYDLASLGYEIT